MTTATLPATGQDPGPDPGLPKPELLMPGEAGRIDDIPAEVWKRLTAPFDSDQIEKRPQVTCFRCTENKKNKRPETCDEHPRKARCAACGQFITPGHIHLDYVGHAGITMRLNEVLTPAGWNWRPMAFTAAGTPLLNDGGMWILLTIGGVTRIGFGDASGKPLTPSAIKEIIGDGIRNAGMRFGIATYLWSKSNAAEQLKNLPTEPEEDYATSLAVAADLGELYLAASRLKQAVDAGAVSEALAALLRSAFNERRAVLNAEHQHSPAGPLPDDHWEIAGPTAANPGAGANPNQGTDAVIESTPDGSWLALIPALADVEVEPPRTRGESEDFYTSLATVTNLEAVDRIEARFTDRFHGTAINATLFVDLAIAASARRAELGGTASAMSPASAALAAILARAAASSRSHKDIARIHALIRHHAAAGNLAPAEATDLMEQCKQVYRTIHTRGQGSKTAA